MSYTYLTDSLEQCFDKDSRDMRLGITTFSPMLFPDGKLWDFNSFVEMVEGYNEQDCFLALSILNGYDNQLKEKTWKGTRPDLVYVIDARDLVLNKVSLDLGTNDNSIDEFVASDKFREWYEKWDMFFTYEKKCEYMEAKMNGEDLSSFVPLKSCSLKKVNN
ncbi:MAG: hypothetical protein J6A52_02235 [Bacilli bacterium]|nr:hypothetical protein [Bacilli bacterium]